MIAIFPPPFDPVDLGSSSTSICDIDVVDDGGIGDVVDSGTDEADEESALPIGDRRLSESEYATPAVPTYFHFTISGDTRIEEALFSDVAVFQENSQLVANSASW